MNQAVKEKLWKYFICVLLAAVTWAAFASVAGDGFIALDDRNYVVGNDNIQHGFSWTSVKWALTAFHSNNWHPLTWLSHMLDCRLFSLDPTGPHLTNLAFHVADTLLLFLLLYNLTAKLWPAAFVAMLFGIHPMHVESVAWISERKDVLSAFFFLLALLAYARYVELVNTKKKLCWTVYAFALLLFALGLLSKPMLVTLPGILFLMDYWPLRRIQLPLKKQSPILRRLAIEKIPFIILSALSCWITYVAQNATGAVKPSADFGLAQRLAHIPVSCAWYLAKLFWPLNLSIFYPLRTQDSEDFLSPLLLLLVISLLAIWWHRKYPWLIVGWLWFLGSLVPVVGFVQVGNQSYADRYTYLPYIGLFILIAWGIPEMLIKWPRRGFILWPAAALVTALCFWRTTVEARYWKDGISLFNRALALDDKSEMPWMLLGLEYEVHGNNDKAIECETRATELNNQFNLAWRNLGHMLIIKGDISGAENAFQNALSCAWFGGDKIDAYNNLGSVYVTAGQYPQAIPNFQSSLELFSNQPNIQVALADCFVQNQQPDQAIAAYQNYLNAEPNDRGAQLNLAMLLGGSGRDAEAIPHYQKVIALDTNVLIALNNLSWILATDSDPKLRNGKEAVPLALHACERTHYQEAFLIGTLAAAYAEAGEFDKAVAAAQKAHDVALAHGQKEIADQNDHLLQLYKSGRAFHMDDKIVPSKRSS